MTWLIYKWQVTLPLPPPQSLYSFSSDMGFVEPAIRPSYYTSTCMSASMDGDSSSKPLEADYMNIARYS